MGFGEVGAGEGLDGEGVRGVSGGGGVVGEG